MWTSLWNILHIRKEKDSCWRENSKSTAKSKSETKKIKKTEHFNEVYFSWINGGMTMEEAAMLLGITEKRFYRLTEAEG